MANSPQSLKNLDCDPNRTVVSLAAKPGRFGVTVHNAGYRALGLDMRYEALYCDDIAADLDEIRRRGFVGASVTMPHKQTALKYVDALSEEAAATQSVNTVVNRNGRLVGHNTDVFGAQYGLRHTTRDDFVVILGTGGMAHTMGFVAGPRAEMVPRGKLAQENRSATVVVNATPMGMDGIKTIPDLLSRYPNCRLYVECVVNPTPMQLDAEIRGMEVVSGLSMTFEQAFAQFRLYTGQEAPEEAMRESYNSVN
jgi:shikimate dehydrogenase